MNSKKPKDRVIKLGDAVRQLVDVRISPRQAKFESVAETWSQLVPRPIHRHCRIDGIYGSELKVLVDSPSYACQLRLLSSEFLWELQDQCPRAKIKKIKFVISRL